MSHEIRVPRLGWSMEEGTFVRWLKQPGETVAAGEPLFELEGEKALQEIPSLEAGRLHVGSDAPPPGTVVPVGGLLGHLLVGDETTPSVGSSTPAPAIDVTPQESTPAPRTRVAGPAARRLAREQSVDLTAIAGSGRSGQVTREDIARAAARASSHSTVASPRARRVASELGIDWKSLNGSGRDGRVREADVRQAAVGARSSAAVRPSLYAGLPPRRRAIAERLRSSIERTIPVTLTTSAIVDGLVSLRQQFKASGADPVPSIVDLVACVVAKVIPRHPQVAVRWQPDAGALVSIAPKDIAIGVAVDTPEGLLVPVVGGFDDGPLSIAARSRALVEGARMGRLKAQEMSGGVTTISNLGVFGVDGFTPILSYPEITILGLGAIRKTPEFATDGTVTAAQRMTLSLTFDHAALDGAPAAAYLRDVALALQNAAACLLGP